MVLSRRPHEFCAILAALLVISSLTPKLVGALEKYPLDGISRAIPAKGAVHCPRVELVTWRGDQISLSSPAHVHPEFRARLRKFEAVVRDVAIQSYGRAPTRIRHLGTFVCKRVGGYPELMSEHGLGNAIDIAGFDFPPLSRADAKISKLPTQLRGKFTVKMDPDWDGKSATGLIHAKFLHTLAATLIARQDIFTVLLGPAWPGHKNHFHFDCANYKLVKIFRPEEIVPRVGGQDGVK